MSIILSPTTKRNQAARRWLALAVISLALLLMAGCAQTGQMKSQPRYDPLEASDLFADGRSARPFQPGTVPYMAEGSPNDPALTGLTEDGDTLEGFPVTVDEELLALGQERYTIYCTPCHGPTGEGNGRVVGFGFPKPPDLRSGNAADMTSGQMFNIITNGQGNMFPYGYRVKANERWAVIAYVRALQLKQGAVNTPDLTADEINEIGNQP